jgi:hypothetical protein
MILSFRKYQSNQSKTNTMNNNLTEIAFILDRSASMHSLAEEAIGGFNAFVAQQAKEAGAANISLVLFDHEYTPTLSSMPATEFPQLTKDDYIPRGMTALLDAMGRTIDELGTRLAAMPEDERPGQVIIVTLTDGHENASQDYTNEKLAALIKQQQEIYNWNFIFLGADLSAIEHAKRLNIRGDQTIHFSRTAKGVTDGIACSSRHTSAHRQQHAAKHTK